MHTLLTSGSARNILRCVCSGKMDCSGWKYIFMPALSSVTKVISAINKVWIAWESYVHKVREGGGGEGRREEEIKTESEGRGEKEKEEREE